MLSELQTVFQDNITKKSYDIDIDGFHDINTILHTPSLPFIKEVYFSSTYSATISEKNKGIRDLDKSISEKWIFSDTFSYLNQKNYANSIVQGSYFTNKQLEDGEAVVILSEDIMKQYYTNIKIGDTMYLFENLFRIIGVFKGAEHTCLLPLNYLQYLKTDPQEYEYQITGMTTIFENTLSSQQLEDLRSQLKAYGNTDKKIQSDYENMLFDYYMIAVKYIFLILAILVFCILNIVGLFRYLFGCHIYDYVIYKIYGIKNSFFIALVYGQAFLFMTIAYLLAVWIYQTLEPHLLTLNISISLSGKFQLLVYGITLCIQFAALAPIAYKIIKHSPMNRDLWRTS